MRKTRLFFFHIAVNIWITKNSEVPVAEQLILQVTLGIAGGDLKVGDKLPSTREIGRRFGIHSNTVAAAYRKLVDSTLLEFRKGSGFFVRRTAPEIAERHSVLGRVINEFLEASRRLGYTDREAAEQVEHFVRSNRVRRIRLVEPDKDLRDILEFELRAAGLAVESSGIESLAAEKPDERDLVVAMFDERQRIESSNLNANKCIYLRGRSVAGSLASETRPSNTEVIAVISAWDGFLSMAKVMLLAAKVQPGNLIVRSTKTDGWEAAVKPASLVICDSLTAGKLAKIASPKIFKIIADDCFDEIEAARSHDS